MTFPLKHMIHENLNFHWDFPAAKPLTPSIAGCGHMSEVVALRAAEALSPSSRSWSPQGTLPGD